MFINKKMSVRPFFEIYKKICKKVICVARQRENDGIIKRSVNKSKTLWQIIKKETANSHNEIENISLQID
jgi:hypothetical protein